MRNFFAGSPLLGMQTEDGQRERRPWSERPIAPGMGVTWRLVISLFESAIDLWETIDAKRRQVELDRRRATAFLAIREEREMAVEMARKTGGALAALKHVEGARGWVRDVRAMGINEDSACQRVALFYFAKNWPTIYMRCRFLGLTKVFKIVRAMDEVVLKLLPDVIFERGGHAVPLSKLTDTDYRDYVNGLLKAAPKPLWDRALRNARSTERAVMQLRPSDVPHGAGVADLQAWLTGASAHLTALAPP